MATDGTRRRWVLPVIGVALVAVVAALALFQPWKLVLDQEVDEAAPTAVASAPTSGTTGGTATAAGSSSGSGNAAATTAFVAKAHPTSGQVRLVPTADGSVVRIEGLDTDNGPDLVVHLVPATADAANAALGEGALDLGPLKGNVGNQNYVVPAGTDLSRYRSVVIWCRRFAVPFGAAPLPS
ncbi:MAG: DM13 domain-containing protein [Acidimicrobiales bacterium]